MRPPNKRHSDPRNTHIPSFSLDTPVWVQPCSPGCGLWGTATSLILGHLFVGSFVGWDGVVAGVVMAVMVVMVVVVVVVVVGMGDVGIGRRFQAEPVDPEEQDERADGGEAEVEDDA